MLAYARVTHHGTYLQSLYGIYMTVHTVSFLYKGILYLRSNKMLTKSRLSTQKLWVLSTIILILVIRRVPNHSSWTACFGLFKLWTCSSRINWSKRTKHTTTEGSILLRCATRPRNYLRLGLGLDPQRLVVCPALALALALALAP